MAQFKITEARLRTIKERQWEERWGPNYVAGIWADPREAPGISTGSILRPTKVGGREFHTLSAAETFMALLLLKHPQCWEVQEQRVLHPLPRAHPLAGHPRASGRSFRSMLGTIEIADLLGIKHPRVRLKVGPSPDKWPMAPFPFFGDLLAFFEDELGPYAVNFPVKGKFADFKRRGPKVSRRRPDQDDPGAILRQQLESDYYASGGVRTQPVSRDQLPDDLCWNLRDLFLDESYSSTASQSQKVQALEIWRESIGCDVPAYLTARRIARDCGVVERDAAALLRQGIWRGELRVDLFRPILMDKPLQRELVDPMVKFGHWFVR